MRQHLHKPVHPFIGWMVLLNVAFVAALPGALFAQSFFYPAPTTDAQQPAAGGDCAARCQTQKSDCATAAGSDQAKLDECSALARACYDSCRSAAPQQPSPSFPPTAGGSAGDSESCIRERCEKLKADCAAKVSASPDASAQCETAISSCIAACKGGRRSDDTNLQPYVKGDKNFQPSPESANGGFQGRDGNSGPNEEQQKQMQQRGLDQAKRGVANFGRQLQRIKTRIAQLDKKGIKAPTALTDALAQADELLAQVKAAATFDDLQVLDMNQLQDIGDTIQQEMPNLERLANLPTMYKRIDRQLKTFDRQLASDKALAAKSKIDLTSAIANFETDLAAVKEAYAAAKGKIASGDVEAGFDALQNDVFDAMGDVGAAHAVVQQIRQLGKTIPQVAREITQFQRQLNRLKAKGEDTSDAQSILDEGRGKVDELKTAAATQPIDPENIFGLLDELSGIRDRFMSALGELTGVQDQNEIDQGIKPSALSLPDFNFDAFGGGRGSGGPNGGPGGGPNGGRGPGGSSSNF